MRNFFRTGLIAIGTLTGWAAAQAGGAGGFSATTLGSLEHNPVSVARSGADCTAQAGLPAPRLLHRIARTCRFTNQSLRPLPFLPQAGDPPQTDTPADGGSQDGQGGQDGGEPVAPKRAFAYHPPGKLHPRDPRKGRAGDRYVYAPGIIFPLALPKGMHPHMNSQIYGRGGGGWGGKGAAGGSECDPKNYDPFTQYDNYCEVRGWKLPLCPAGTGHQGLDIRPPTCSDSKWNAVAVADGKITRVTRNTTVVLKATKDGTSYYYLHMNPRTIRVKRGQQVRQGDVLGKISKYMSGKRLTTTHLHFMAKQNIADGSRIMSTYVPIYTSLIAALRKAKGLGPSIDSDGNLVVDANYEIGAKPPTDTPDLETPDGDPSEPVTDKPEPDKPDPTGPDTDLAQRVAALEQELNQLKVESQREIEKAQGETDAVRATLAERDAKLAAALARNDEREAVLQQTRQAAATTQAELRAELDQAAVSLQSVKAELKALQEAQDAPGIWQRITSWWSGSS